MLWDVTPDGGCDRQTISPDGKLLYVPSFEGPHWTVIDAMTGATITKLAMNSRAHNTLFSRRRRGGLPRRTGVADALGGGSAHSYGDSDRRSVRHIRSGRSPSNGSRTLAYVNVNELLGFEIGDLRTGQKLHRVEVQGYKYGPVARHGCPSHGVGLTPDEREVWVSDGHNSAMHIFDNTVMPPKQIATIKVRDQPGWVTFSMDGRHAYPSTGEVFDVKTRERIAALKDEEGRDVGSEKLVEVVRDGAEDRPRRRPVRHRSEAMKKVAG